MPVSSEWSLPAPRKLDFVEPITSLRVGMVEGTVNVVGTADEVARLELSHIDGPPLQVRHRGNTLTVGYEDLPWKGFWKWLNPRRTKRTVHITLVVPAATHVEVGAVSATTVISGISGHTEVHGVSGESTLVGLSGPVRADMVSGRVEAQSVTGDLFFHSVSGGLTVIDANTSMIRADSVSGDITLDLAPAADGADIQLTNVSGAIALRLPQPANAEVEAHTASGTVTCALDDLSVSGPWGPKQVTGRLGTGSGKLKATTVSGSLTLLRRPAQPPQQPPQPPQPLETVSGTAHQTSTGASSASTDKEL